MIVKLLFETGIRRPLSPPVRAVTKAYAAILAVWVLYNVIIAVTDIFGMTFIFLAAMLALVFVTLAPTTRSTSINPGAVDWTLAALSIITGLYFWWNLETIANRITLFDELTPWEFGMGLLTILLVLEATRRSVGAGLTFIVLVFIAYNLFGHHLSGEIAHGYISVHHFVDTTVYTTDSIYGVPVRVAATYAFLFVLFGTILERAGGAEFFYRIGALVAGRTVGGTAKIAIVSSGAYGMVSGSPVSDVVTTGSVTIPAMENAGYRSDTAGGIEVAASTGGSIMPPVMGSVAFIMSEYTGIPYGKIAIAAIIPAILYYLGVFVQVHYMSKKLGMKSLSKADIPNFVQALQRCELFVVPLAVIVVTLSYGYAATYAAAFGSLAVFVVALFRKGTRIDVLKLYDVLADSTIKVIGVTAACAAAGLVIGGLSMTGLAAKFSALIAYASGDSLFISLFISAAVTILLGMGMPTPSVYILAAALVAPVLLKLQVSVLAANMFLLYFSVLSASTPPVAVAAYAAAAIARANPISISVVATRLSVAAAIVPFSFAYSPELLLQGAWLDVAIATVTAIIGVYLVGVATEGYFNAPLGKVPRILIGLAGLCFVAPSILLAAVGTALAVLGFAPALYPRFALKRQS